jgi:hypothetical protein
MGYFYWMYTLAALLTCRQNTLYNVGIMNNTFQLTIRGLDPATKSALVKKANKQGLSLNRYALKALQQSVGIDDSEKRYLEMKQFLSVHKISSEDNKTFNEALSWSDKASLAKQSKK